MRGDDGTIAIKGAKSSAMLRKTRYEHHISYTDSVHGRLGIGHHTKPLAHLGRWLLGLLMVVGVVAVARWWSGTGEPVAALCITQNVTRGDLTAMVTATGTLTPINQVDVGTELSGIVRSVAVDYWRKRVPSSRARSNWPRGNYSHNPISTPRVPRSSAPKPIASARPRPSRSPKRRCRQRKPTWTKMVIRSPITGVVLSHATPHAREMGCVSGARSA